MEKNNTTKFVSIGIIGVLALGFLMSLGGFGDSDGATGHFLWWGDDDRDNYEQDLDDESEMESECDDNVCTLYEGASVNYGGKKISINFLSSNGVKLQIGNEITSRLSKGESQKMEDGALISIKDIFTQDYSGGVRYVIFEIFGVNQDLIPRAKVDFKPSGTNTSAIRINVELEDGPMEIVLLNEDGVIGRYTDERLATSPGNVLTFYEKANGIDYHKYFVASADEKSYLLRAKVYYDSADNRNETTIERKEQRNETIIGKKEQSHWVEVCDDKYRGATCDIGEVNLEIGTISYTSGGDESVLIIGDDDVEFDMVYTKRGLKIGLPYEHPTNATSKTIDFY